MNTIARTENGALAHSTSSNNVLDLFFKFGAARGQADTVADMWFNAQLAEPALALRVALWGRDARGGAGEREAFRAVLRSMDGILQFDNALLEKIAEVGRADDLLVVTKNFDTVAKFYKDKIDNSDAGPLFAKWTPRKGNVANALRKAWKFRTPKEYRQYIVRNTECVEQAMCAKKWDEVEYKHVPSVAMARYNSAFKRNDETRFAEFKEALKRGDTTINASVVFPHDIVRTSKGNDYDVDVLQAQWNAQPDFMEGGKNILVMSDVSGSMDTPVSGSVTAMDISIALGLYVSERQSGPFKDLVLTFSSTPKFHKVVGDTIVDRINNLGSADWGMSTDLDAAFRLILKIAVEHGVPAEDMPEALIVISDMEFDFATRRVYRHPRGAVQSTLVEQTNHESATRLFEQAGYKLPTVVYWNVNSRSNIVPVRAHESGAALVSGFSPAIMKAVLASDADELNPTKLMLDVIMDSRYDVPGWTC